MTPYGSHPPTVVTVMTGILNAVTRHTFVDLRTHLHTRPRNCSGDLPIIGARTSTSTRSASASLSVTHVHIVASIEGTSAGREPSRARSSAMTRSPAANRPVEPLPPILELDARQVVVRAGRAGPHSGHHPAVRQLSKRYQGRRQWQRTAQQRQGYARRQFHPAGVRSYQRQGGQPVQPWPREPEVVVGRHRDEAADASLLDHPQQARGGQALASDVDLREVNAGLHAVQPARTPPPSLGPARRRRLTAADSGDGAHGPRRASASPPPEFDR